MTNWQLRGFLLLVAGLLVSSNLLAQSETGVRKARVVAYVESDQAKELYVAIMGEVTNPGTYHLDLSSLNLHSIVSRAGGFTSDASRVIRVIRKGRVSQNEVYSQTANTPLIPGDLLIAEPRQSAGVTHRVVEFASAATTVHATYQERPRTSIVQIGLLNVADYPVVLRLRSDDANAERIIAGLRQPIQLLSDADVITPGRRIVSDVAKQMPRLPDGSVIVFARHAVNRDNLPASLPKPIESAIALGAQIGLIGSPYGQSAELRSLGGKLFSPTAESSNSGSRFNNEQGFENSRPVSSFGKSATDDLRSELSAPPATLNPRIATIPFSGTPQIKNSSTAAPRFQTATTDTIPIPEDTTGRAEVITEEDELPPVADEQVDKPQATFSLTQIFVVFSIIGGLILAAVGARKLVESSFRPSFRIPAIIDPPSSSDNLEPIVQQTFSSKPLLEQLIKNELPISLEPIEFPAGLMLQGRLAPKPVLRVDGPQSILKDQGPHFASLGQSPPVSQDVITQFDLPESSPVRRPHFFGSDQRKAETVTSQLPADGHAKAPLAKALFELEQGGRS